MVLYFLLFVWSVSLSNASLKFKDLNEVHESAAICETLFEKNNGSAILNETSLNNETTGSCFSKCIYEKAGLISKQGYAKLSSMVPIISNFIAPKSQQQEAGDDLALNLITICESNIDTKWICLKSTQLINCLEIAVYLYNYGYLSEQISREQRDYSNLKFIFMEAVIKFQQYFKLKITGVPGEDMQQLITLPRCKVPDLNAKFSRRKRFLQPVNKWRKQVLTYRILEYPEKIPKEKVDDEIAEAFREWVEQTPLKIERKTSGEVDIEIKFSKDDHGDKVPFDGPGGLLGHAAYPKLNKRRDQKSFIHFDSTENWTLGRQLGGGGLPILQVALHEIGHSLGLKHSKKKDAVMWPLYGYKSGKNISLDKEDVRRIQRLYNSKNDSGWFTKIKNLLHFFHW